MAYVFSPTGVPGEVPDERAEAAYKAGYKPRQPTAEELAKKQAAEQPGLAAVEGLARGATAGFGENLVAQLHHDITGKPRLQALKEMKLRKEENPLASGAGEIGGALGVSLATGGGASALVGGGMRGALVEGGLYGMGSMVSEDALNNREASVDSLAAGFAGGALASGAVHGGFSLLGKGVSAVTSKFGGKGLKDTLGNLADDVEWKSLTRGSPASLVKRLEPYKKEILRSGRESGVLNKVTSAFDDAAVQKSDEFSKSFMKKVFDEADNLEEIVPLSKTEGLRSEAADYLEGRLRSEFDLPVYDEALKSMQKNIDAVRNKKLTWRGYWEIQSSLFKEKVGDTAAGEVREGLRRAMRDFVYDEVASGKNKAGAVLSAFEPKGRIQGSLPRAVAEATDVVLDGSGGARGAGVFDLPTSQTVEGFHPELRGTQLLQPDTALLPLGRDIPGALGRTRGAVDIEGAVQHAGGIFEFPGSVRVPGAAPSAVVAEALPAPKFAPLTIQLGEEGVEKAGGLSIALPEKKTPAWLGAQMRQTGRDSAAAQGLAKLVANRTRSLGTGLEAIERLSVGGIAGVATGNPIVALASAAADSQLRKRGGLMGGAALRAISESRLTDGISRNLSKHLGTILATAPEVLGAYRYPLSVAAAKGADALVQEHLRLASSDEGQNYLSTVALEVEDDHGVEAAGQRLAVLDAIEARTQEHKQEMDSAINALFGTAPGRKSGLGGGMTPKDFEKTSAAIEAMLADPNVAFEQVPPEFRGAAPETSTWAAAKVLQAAQFLSSKMPKSPFSGPPALQPPWKPSQADIDRFDRYREAVVDPGQVLKNMANGFVAPEQVEALQVVYPVMYQNLKEAITMRLMQQKKPLPYQQQLAVAAILGPQALGMSPQQAQILQQSHAIASGPPPGTGGTSEGSPDGRQDVNEDQIQTEAQKLEAR
jgi:hypothetical protein